MRYLLRLLYKKITVFVIRKSHKQLRDLYEFYDRLEENKVSKRFIFGETERVVVGGYRLKSTNNFFIFNRNVSWFFIPVDKSAM